LPGDIGGGGAGADEDGVAGVDQPGGRPGDADLEVAVLLHPLDHRRLRGRFHREDGPAMSAADKALPGQLVEVAADRDLADPEDVAQLRDGHLALLAERLQRHSQPFFFE